MKKGNTFGIILILIGIGWIIRQTGVVPMNWSAAISALWPLIFVTIGAGLLAGHRKRLAVGIWILTFMIFIGYGVYKRNEPIKGFHFDQEFNIGKKLISKTEKQPFQEEIPLPEGTEEGKIILGLGGVNLNIQKGSNDLFVQANTNVEDLKQRLVEGKQTLLEYGHEKYRSNNTIRNIELRMNPTLLWEMETNLGVVDGRMDFSEILLKRMDLQLGAGKMELILGSEPLDTQIELRAGASDIDIYVPEDAGLRIKSGNILTDLSFHNISLKNENGVFITENFETASRKIEINVISALSAVQILVQ